MGIWTKPGQEDRALMRSLRRLAEGYDRFGRPVDHATQMEAARRYQAIRIEKGRLANERLRAESDKSRAESDRMRAENDRVRAMAEVEKLRAEASATLEKLQIEKASVIVQALEVAQKSGASADQILAAIGDLSTRLLPSGEAKEPTALPQDKSLPALEDKAP